MRSISLWRRLALMPTTPKKFIDRGDHATARDNLANISALIKRAARIIQNLRTYARNEPVALTAVSLNHAIEAALEIVDRRVVSDGIEIQQFLSGNDVMIEGGEVRLQQVFVNLLTNSIDAMAVSQEKQIVILVEDSGDEVQVPHSR